MGTVTTLTGIPTQNLRAGDIVHAHGMRVRLDTLKTRHGGYYRQIARNTAGTCTGAYGPAGTDSCDIIYSWSGTVLTDLEEIRSAGIVPVVWLRTERWEDGQGWITDRTDHWTIQGNFRATWTLEIDLGTLQLAGD